MLFLSSVHAYLRFEDAGGRRWYGAALGLFTGALLSKPVAAVFPVIMLLLRWARGLSIGRRQAWQLFPFFLLALGMGLLTLSVEASVLGPRAYREVFRLSAPQHLLLAGRALWFYPLKLLFPVDLAFSYERWHLDAADLSQWLWVIATFAAAGVLWRFRGRVPRLALSAAGFYLLSIAPMLGVFDLYTFRYSFVADHYQYLASLGVIASVVGAASRRLRRAMDARGVHGPRLGVTVLAVLVVASLGSLVWRQCRIYRDDESLWRDTLAKNPDSFLAHTNLGLLHFARGDPNEALAHQREAVRLHPGGEEHYNLGNTLAALGRTEEALDRYRSALEVRPFAAAYTNMAIELFGIGRRAEAIAAYRAALALEPGYFEAHFNLGLDLMEMGSLAEALPHLGRAVRLSPASPDAHQNLGTVLQRLGRVAEAQGHFLEAARLRGGLRGHGARGPQSTKR